MKQALLFAAFVFSMNAYAQKLQPVSAWHSTLFSIEKLQSKLDGAGITGGIPGFNVAKDINHPSRETFDLIQLIDSIYNWSLDSASLTWSLDSKIVDYLYNDDGLPTSFTLLSWTGSEWENGAQGNFTYDANNNQTSASISLWNGIAWQILLQITNTYDSHKNLTSQVEQFSNGITLMNSSRTTYTYDANDNLLTEIYESWNGIAWENSEKTIYNYDASNNNTSILIQNWNGASWVDARNATLTYDANHNLISETDQIWNITEWVNLGQYTYTYNGNNDLTSELTKSWDGSNWVNYSFLTNAYDGHNLVNERLQLWDGFAFVLSESTMNTYDPDDFLESISYRQFDATGTVIAGDSSFYYYHTATGIKDLSAGDGIMEVYPNPSNGKFTISSETTLLSVEVYNSLGARIYSSELKAQPTNEINLAGYGKGIFIVITSDGVNNYSQKIIIQ